MKITDKHILEAKQLLEQRKAEYWIQHGVVNTLEKMFINDSVTESSLGVSIEENKNVTESTVSDTGDNSSESNSGASSPDTL